MHFVTITECSYLFTCTKCRYIHLNTYVSSTVLKVTGDWSIRIAPLNTHNKRIHWMLVLTYIHAHYVYFLNYAVCSAHVLTLFSHRWVCASCRHFLIYSSWHHVRRLRASFCHARHCFCLLPCFQRTDWIELGSPLAWNVAHILPSCSDSSHPYDGWRQSTVLGALNASEMKTHVSW